MNAEIALLAIIAVGIVTGIIAPVGLYLQKPYLSFVAAMINLVVMLSALLATGTGVAISEDAKILWLVNLSVFASAVMVTIALLGIWSHFQRH